MPYILLKYFVFKAFNCVTVQYKLIIININVSRFATRIMAIVVNMY